MDPLRISQTRRDSIQSVSSETPELTAKEQAIKEEWDGSGVIKGYLEHYTENYVGSPYSTLNRRECDVSFIIDESQSDDFKELKAQAIYANLLTDELVAGKINELIEQLFNLSDTCLKAKELVVTLMFRCVAAKHCFYTDSNLHTHRVWLLNQFEQKNKLIPSLRGAYFCYLHFMRDSSDEVVKAQVSYYIGFMLLKEEFLFNTSKDKHVTLGMKIFESMGAHKDVLGYAESQYYLNNFYLSKINSDTNDSNFRDKIRNNLFNCCQIFIKEPSIRRQISLMPFITDQKVLNCFSAQEQFIISNKISYYGARDIKDDFRPILLRLWILLKYEKSFSNSKAVKDIDGECLSDVNKWGFYTQELGRLLKGNEQNSSSPWCRQDMVVWTQYPCSRSYINIITDIINAVIEKDDFDWSLLGTSIFYMLVFQGMIKHTKDRECMQEVSSSLKKRLDKQRKKIKNEEQKKKLEEALTVEIVRQKAWEKAEKATAALSAKVKKQKALKERQEKEAKKAERAEKKKQKENNNKPKAVSNQEPEKEKEKEKEVRLREDSIGSEESSAGSNASTMSTEELARQAGVAPELINQLLEQKYGAGDIHKRNTVSVKKPKRVSVKGQGGSQKERPKSVAVPKPLSEYELRQNARSNPTQKKDEFFKESIEKFDQYERFDIYASINILKEEWPNVKSGNLSFKGLNGNGLDDVYQIYAGPSGAYRVLFMETKIGTLENPRSELTLLDVYRKKSDEMPKEQKETIARLAKKYRKA